MKQLNEASISLGTQNHLVSYGNILLYLVINIWQPLIKLPTFIYTATPSLSYWENVFEIVIILNIPHPLILLKITLKTNTF